MGTPSQLPELSNAGLRATAPVAAINEFGESIDGNIAIERALTLYLDKREIITLMTLGNYPELLVLGWLRNQRLVKDLNAIKQIHVDWEVEAAAISTRNGVEDLDDRLSQKTVTSGCGQGTVFGDLMEDIDEIRLQQPTLAQSSIYELLNALNQYNDIYRSAGAVHGCALCSDEGEILQFIEDVGRHNAVDAIAGYMWMNNLSGADKIFYTTGRLTSEMVIKVALMGIPVLLSRSGITAMGLEIAQKVGVTLIARAKGKHFLVYHGSETIVHDAVPSKPRLQSKTA